MQIFQGKTHEHLAMTLNFAVPREVKITMIPHLKQIVKLLSKQHDSSESLAAAPAPAECLFKVNDNVESLSERLLTICHNFLLPSVCFSPTASVKSSDVNDCKRLIARMIPCLHRSIGMPLILCVDFVPVPKWWIDGSHAAHPDVRGHLDADCMSLGKGMPINASAKQKLNTRSSVETELIAADDFMPIMLWTNHFLDAQGHGHQDAVLHQDNQSAILFKKNGDKSSSKRTKHLNCRFYFITNRINMNELSIERCRTEEMVDHFFTKPLQGKLFYKFRALIIDLQE
jgi:hypothetical protein